MQRKHWLLWVVLAALLLRLAAWLYFRGHVVPLVTMRLPDDALYYFTIAGHLARGHGISFDGVHPTNGMHPLWLFVILPVFLLHLSKWASIHAVLLLQSVLDGSIVWLIGLTVYEALPRASESNRRTAAGMVAVVYALSTLAMLRGINGMETTLAAIFFILWFRAFLRVETFPRLAPWVSLGIVTGLLLLARTDSFIVLLPICLSFLRSRWKQEWRRILLSLLLASIIIAPWILWNLANFGTIMQASSEAVPMLAFRKLHALYGSSIFWHLLFPALRNALKPFWYAALGLPLLTVGYAILARRKSLSAEERAIYWLMAGGVILLLVHSLFRGFIRDWYIEELVPLFLIGFGISIGANAGEGEVRISGRWALATVLVFSQFFFFGNAQYRSQAIVWKSGVPIAEALSRRATIASFNAGYYGYFARSGSIVDLDGVINNEALVALRSGRLGRYIKSDSVSYLLDFRGDFGGYKNLFDSHLLDGFVLDSQAIDIYDTNNPLLLYRRRQ